MIYSINYPLEIATYSNKRTLRKNGRGCFSKKCKGRGLLERALIRTGALNIQNTVIITSNSGMGFMTWNNSVVFCSCVVYICLFLYYILFNP